VDNVVSWCYITIAEAAEYLQVSDRTVRRLIADGELMGYRMGRFRRIIERVDLTSLLSKPEASKYFWYTRATHVSDSRSTRLTVVRSLPCVSGGRSVAVYSPRMTWNLPDLPGFTP
jgi:excisionase family DNA binding protein